MPVFEAKSDTCDRAGEAILARILFPTAEARDAAIARGKRMAEGDNPFVVRPAVASGLPVPAACSIRSATTDGALTTSGA